MSDLNLRCSICGNIEEKSGNLEKWTTDDGFVVMVPKNDAVSVGDPRRPDERIVCGKCYQQGLLTDFNEDEIFEIHMEFGYGYIGAGDLSKAEAAFRNALKIRVTADGLAHLAYCLAERKDVLGAERMYLLALDIDENHWMALNNINKLRD